jgi:hypothetical protein
MRFIIMHKTNAHWEAGAIPTPELIARVGGLLGQLAKAGLLLAAEGPQALQELAQRRQRARRSVHRVEGADWWIRCCVRRVSRCCRAIGSAVRRRGPGRRSRRPRVGMMRPARQSGQVRAMAKNVGIDETVSAGLLCVNNSSTLPRSRVSGWPERRASRRRKAQTQPHPTAPIRVKFRCRISRRHWELCPV